LSVEPRALPQKGIGQHDGDAEQVGVVHIDGSEGKSTAAWIGGMNSALDCSASPAPSGSMPPLPPPVNKKGKDKEVLRPNQINN